MGNTQTNEGKPGKAGKSKVKGIKKIRGKKNQGDLNFTEINPKVLDEKVVEKSELKRSEIQEKIEDIKIAEVDEKQISLQIESPKATDSWYSLEEENISKLATPCSVISSENNFVDAPQSAQETFNSESNTSSNNTPNNFLHNLTLNSFKLNEYRMKHEAEKSQKLNKLGVSKISQISLDSNPRERFETGEVHVIKREMENNICVDEQMKEVRKDNNVVHVNKRMSESNIKIPGKSCYIKNTE